MGIPSEKQVSDQESPGETAVISEKYADVTLRIVEDHGKDFGPLTPEKEKKLQWKLYLHVMGLLSAINLLLFIDKSTLGYAAILGLFEETGISKAQYNNLGTFFYVGYLAAQWPGHYAMQKLPFGKFVAGLVFMWGVTVLLHCAATTYAGLVVLRLLLGASESVVVPAMEMTIGMFFNRHEQSFLQPFLWVTSAAAPVCAAFISYGLLWSKSSVLPWKLFMVITGGLSVLLSVVVWFHYPSNPAEAKFLTLEEKVHTIQRVHESTQSSIEQKQFKKEQFVETLRDPVSWLFCLQSFTLMLSNNLTYGQQNLITKALGVTSLGSTLVAAAGGGFGILVCLAGTFALRFWPSNLALHGLVWCVPAIAGGIGMVAMDWDEKLGMLACLLLAGHTYGNTYIIALGWTTSSAAGYTKKLTRNVMFMLGYSVANLISPQIWVPSDAPRYYGAWIAQIVVSWAGTPAILFVIQIILKRRNSERKAWAAGLTEEERRGHQLGEVEQLDEGGVLVRRKVDIALLDLTDLENPFFIYPI
ncbi:major facilitator superfamily domain-containing protein [Ilyonectria destructans]|nr:major facilitator superfamily domain-containing protein [Ilyonectria destructans]